MIEYDSSETQLFIRMEFMMSNHKRVETDAGFDSRKTTIRTRTSTVPQGEGKVFELKGVRAQLKGSYSHGDSKTV